MVKLIPIGANDQRILRMGIKGDKEYAHNRLSLSKDKVNLACLSANEQC